MAFTPVDGVIALGEELMAAAFKAALGVELPCPFPRMTYAEAMDRYGCDKPDTRYGLELRDISAVVRGTSVFASMVQCVDSKLSFQVDGCSFKLFADSVAAGGLVKAITVPNGARIKNSALKAKGDVFEQAVGAAGLPLVYARVAVAADGAVTLDAGKAVKEALEGREKALVRLPGVSFARVLPRR
jgi:aspartyl-tRNA synthetase